MKPFPGELVEAAVVYTENGWAVFPVAGKVPLTARGFKDAAGTEGGVRDLFRAHPGATGVGVACGASGLLVIDLDGEGGRLGWTRLAARQGDTVPTRISVTPRGWHLWFRTRDPRARSTAGRLATYVDTRGPGGYVVAPPSLHPSGRTYRWRDTSVPVAEAPGWLLEALEPPPAPPVGPFREIAADTLVTPYGRVALAALAADMRAAVEGVRNATLVGVSYRAGRLTAAGEIEAGVARDALIDAALSTGLPADEAERTFSSGFSAGRLVPAMRASR